MAERSVTPCTPASADLPVFLVERYLASAAALELPASVARLAGLCSASTESRSDQVAAVRYLSSVYLPGEDTCFCLFRAPTIEAVRSLNEAAGFPLDRITRAVLLLPAEMGHTGSHHSVPT